MHEICFPLPNGQQICIPIPVLLIEWKPIPDPDPDPWRVILDNWIDVGRPDPDPWRELPIVATVAALADIAPTKDLEQALRDVVQVQMDRLAEQLPDEASLEFSKGRMAAAAR